MSNDKERGQQASARAAAVTTHGAGSPRRTSVHLRPGTALATVDYPAEGRTVVKLGDPESDHVAVFVRLPELAQLIDTLNDAYTRLTTPERRPLTPCAQRASAGASPRPTRRPGLSVRGVA